MCVFAVLLWVIIKGDLKKKKIKRNIFIYLAILGMFVGKWWAVWTKLPSLGGRWVNSWVWIQQQPVTVSCWLSLSIAYGNLSPFLPWTGDTRGFWGAHCWLLWSEPRCSLQLLTEDPFFCPSWLRMLSGRDAPRLECQRLALFSWAAPGLSPALAALWLHQGYSTVGLAFIAEAEISEAVSASLQLCVHSASALMSVELLQLYRNAEEVPVKLTVFKEFGLDLPDQARCQLRWIRKKSALSQTTTSLCCGEG